MKRLPDWESRLQEFLQRRGEACHTWGVTDCCMNAADAVLAITGEDLAAEFRGRYTTAAGATRALKRYGAGTLGATLDAKLPSNGRAFARRGDLALVEGLIAIVIGADAVALGDVPTEDGLCQGWVHYPRQTWANKIWSVG